MTAEDVPGGADWNANEGEAGYVKNRTHYEVVTYQAVLPETDIEHETRYTGGLDENLEKVHNFAIREHESPVKITYDGVEYAFPDGFSCLPYYSDEPDDYGMTKHHVGNPALCPDISNGYGLEENDIPFCVYMESPGNGWIYFADGGSHNMAIYGGEKEIKPLDPKFLAETAPSANQQLVTDADGKTVWEEKPFYSDRTPIAHIENESVSTYGEDGSYYSSQTFGTTELPEDITSLVGAKVDAVINGTQITGVFQEVTYYFDYWMSDRTSVAAGNLRLLNNKNAELPDTGEDWCITVHVGEAYPYAHGVTFTVYGKANEEATVDLDCIFETIQTLPEKFIPDTIARKSDVGGNVLIVTLTGEDYTKTPDKTLSEIRAAVESGMACFMLNNAYDDMGMYGSVVPLSYLDEEKAVFNGIHIGSDPYNPDAYVMSGIVNADGTGRWMYNAFSGVNTPT